jgi:hypothetical protein
MARIQEVRYRDATFTFFLFLEAEISASALGPYALCTEDTAISAYMSYIRTYRPYATSIYAGLPLVFLPAIGAAPARAAIAVHTHFALEPCAHALGLRPSLIIRQVLAAAAQVLHMIQPRTVINKKCLYI